jgi:hypothetical protein
MTLTAFAGVALMNITLGVPKIQETVNATKTIIRPIITGKLVEPESPVFQRIMSRKFWFLSSAGQTLHFSLICSFIICFFVDVSKSRQIVGTEGELFARIIKSEAERLWLFWGLSNDFYFFLFICWRINLRPNRKDILEWCRRIYCRNRIFPCLSLSPYVLSFL